MLQAHVRATLSYEFDVEHVSATVEVIPYVTVFPNTTITSWSTHQLEATATLGLNQTSVVSDVNGLNTELTWEHDGLTL